MELKTARGRLFLVLMAIIALPLLQFCFNVVESGKLLGAMESHPRARLTPDKWWDATYQQQTTLFINDSIGFRSDLIRMNNQLDFNLFRKLHAGDEYIGSDNYIFDKFYTDEYYGITRSNDSIIRAELVKLKKVQDTLERLGKTFIMVYAPSKPYLFPDKIPAILRPTGARKTSDYETFVRIGDSLHICQLDFNGLFIKMKDTSRYPLMTKGGVHWSMYGSVLAAGTFIRFLETKRYIRMPEISIQGVTHTTEPQLADDDLKKPTNLIFPFLKDTYTYTQFRYDNDTSLTRPKAIYIGDSFVWLWIYDNLMRNTNTDFQFWSYFYEAWDINGPTTMNNWQQKILSTDCVIVVFTPPNLVKLLGKDLFVEKMYDLFYPAQK